MDPKTRNYKGRKEAIDAKRVTLRTFLDGIPAYTSIMEDLSYVGTKAVAARVAVQLATAVRNSVRFRIWGLQRKALRYRLRDHVLALTTLLVLSGKTLEKLLNELQLFLRDPRNHRDDGDCGSPSPERGAKTHFLTV